MNTITAKIPDDLLERLNAIAEHRDRSKSYLVREAVNQFIAEQEEDARDLRIAEKALAEDDGTRYSFEEMVEELGLEL